MLLTQKKQQCLLQWIGIEWLFVVLIFPTMTNLIDWHEHCLLEVTFHQKKNFIHSRWALRVTRKIDSSLEEKMNQTSLTSLGKLTLFYTSVNILTHPKEKRSKLAQSAKCHNYSSKTCTQPESINKKYTKSLKNAHQFESFQIPELWKHLKLFVFPLSTFE